MRGPARDLRQHILDRITATPDRAWTPTDFLDIGPRAAVDKALQRLVAAGDLRRIDRGLYDRPHVSQLTGTLTAPDPSAIVDAIARRDRARLVVDGMMAANDLGLTTAVPAQLTVLTDARRRPIHLGRQQITFKQAAPSRLYWASRPGMRVVQALHWLHDVLPSDRDRILARLATMLDDPDRGPVIRDDLRRGLPMMPTWMQSIVRDLVEDHVASQKDAKALPPTHDDNTNDRALKRPAERGGRVPKGKRASEVR